MNDRRKILELFEAQSEYMNDRVNNGIEAYRKGYAEITVKDENGNAIPDAKIKAVQKTHEFKFGANLFMLDELESDEKNEKYKEVFADTFNMATLPFYWSTLESERGKPRYDKNSPKVYRRPAPDLCIEYCKEHGIEPREHALAYNSFFPEWLRNASIAEQKSEIERHYAEISERYKDKIPTIEVTNEMYWKDGKTSFYNDPDYIRWCFALAEKYFPANQLVINESTGHVWNQVHRATEMYYASIEANLLKGARIDAIGMQYHMFFKSEDEYERTRPYYDPKNLYATMDLYANFGKPIQITEVTVPAYSNDEEDEALQAEILEKLYSIWFSHPNVEQIIYWNVIDGYAHFWDPDPAKIRASMGNMSLGENYYYGGLMRFDMTPKPALLKLKELIDKRWHTEKTITSSAAGEAMFKGFYGDYDIEITVNGKTVRKNIRLSKESKNKFNIVI